MQSNVRADDSTRPKRNMQPPPYLHDYDVSYTGARRTNTDQPIRDTVQCPVRAPEENLYSPVSSRSSSAVSQDQWHYTVDEWTSSVVEDMNLGHPTRATSALRYSSPYQRPREPFPQSSRRNQPPI
ncbi:unnamed protein product [Knipowitschia caucasica]